MSNQGLVGCASLRAMLDAKIASEEVHDATPAVPESNVIDLMAALRKSLGDAPKPVEATAPKAPAKRAQKAAEEQRKQPGLKLPIDGGGRKAAKEAPAAAEKAMETDGRPRRRA